jgi:hypothetical protein
MTTLDCLMEFSQNAPGMAILTAGIILALIGSIAYVLRNGDWQE